MWLPPGAPCDGLRGYCDVFRRCRTVDDEGPLTHLQRLFFQAGSVDVVRDFVRVRRGCSLHACHFPLRNRKGG
ncbi:disintegrin and metalloproteinase domain-containing protein 10-like [Haemaphysalis longicornis]